VKRTESLRKSGDKPHGGQPGHVGQTLLASEAPDRIETHAVLSCGHGQASLTGIESVGESTQAAFDGSLVGKDDGTRLELIVGDPAAGVLGKGGGEAFPVLLVESLGLVDEGFEI
jgi:hypothetical protein